MIDTKVPVFVFLILFCHNTPAIFTCQSLFVHKQKVSFDEIGFGQNFLGHRWADHRLDQLFNSYQLWLTKHPEQKPATYLLEQTRQKPFPVFRDLDGQLRKFDKHHRHLAYQRFMENNRSFPVYITLFFDYTKPNPTTGKAWKKEEMMDHALENGFINMVGIRNPSFQELRNLPRNIENLPDSPLRSLMSFVLRNLPLPLGGSDFQSMIQFRLAEAMMVENINLYSRIRFDKSNINDLTQKLLENPNLLQFLIDQINPKAPKQRQMEVRDFLMEHLNRSRRPRELRQEQPIFEQIAL